MINFWIGFLLGLFIAPFGICLLAAITGITFTFMGPRGD